jgi:L-galactose dehydrogenase
MDVPSRLGFGGSPLGGVFGHEDEAEGIRSVHRALELGVTYFDVAPLYGQTRAETVLGRALRGVEREGYFLSTKVGRYGPREFDFSARRVTDGLKESMERLGVDRVDLVLCHDIEFAPLEQVVEEAIPALRELQSRGDIGRIGVSGLPLHIFEHVWQRERLDAILSYCRYTLFDTALDGLLERLGEVRDTSGLMVINAAPLGMGLLTDIGPQSWHPADAETKRLCAAAAAHCRERGADISRLALQFALANPRVHSTLVGMGDRATVERNARWSEEPMDLDLLREVQEILAPVKDRIWSSGA